MSNFFSASSIEYLRLFQIFKYRIVVSNFDFLFPSHFIQLKTQTIVFHERPHDLGNEGGGMSFQCNSLEENTNAKYIFWSNLHLETYKHISVSFS
jgi:hypothetical protein